MTTTRLLGFGLLCLWLATTTAAAASFEVVAHPGVPVSRISRSDLARVFMKKQLAWSDGTAIAPVDQAGDASVREAFSQAVHQKKAAAVAAYWQKQIFSGRDVPPVTRASDAEVIAFVAATPGAIGYISGNKSASGVKKLEVD